MTGCDVCDGFGNSNLHKLQRTCEISNDSSCDVCTDLGQLESQILAAKEGLKRLFEQHRKLRTQANRVHDKTVYRLPIEIVSTIFALCMPEIPPDDGGTLRSLGRDQLAAPLVLSAICQYWRRIAFSTPQLWCLISISVDNQNLMEYFDASREWIARAGHLPLSIGIYSNTKSLQSDLLEMDSFSSLIELINEHASRWHVLDLEIPGQFISRFFGGSAQPVRNLRRLRLYPTSGDVNIKFAMQTRILTPEEIILYAVRLKDIKIGWNRLTQASLERVRVDECLELLKCASQLRVCCFYDASEQDDEEDFPIEPRTVLHNRLQELVIKSSTMSILLIFDELTLPSLEILDAHCYTQSWVPIRSILDLLHRSSCVLRDLLFTVENDFDHDTLIDLLRHIPSLYYLKLYAKGFHAQPPDELFKHLSRTYKWNESQLDATFLPVLRYFCYQQSGSQFSWPLVPDIFGPLSSFNEPQRRPLELMDLRLPFLLEYIDKQTISRISALGDANIQLCIMDLDEEQDFIEVSAKHHGLEWKTHK